MNILHELTEKEKHVIFHKSLKTKEFGGFTDFTISDYKLQVMAEDHSLTIELCEEGIFRITLGEVIQQQPVEIMNTYMIQKNKWSSSSGKWHEEGTLVIGECGDYCIKVDKRDSSLAIYQGQKLIVESSLNMFTWNEEHVKASLKKQQDEYFYGLGLKNTYPHNEHEIAHISQFNHWEGKPVPFFVSNKGYGLLLNTSIWDTRFDFRDNDEVILKIPQCRHIDLFFFCGDQYESILSKYCTVTGHPFMPPKWSFGYWHGKYGYRTQEEFEEVARQFRKRKIPLDLLFLDLHWRGAYSALEISDLTWDTDCFPEPEKMLKDIHDQNIHIFGHMNTSCMVYAKDFTNPEHVRQWQEQVPPIVEAGFDGCMVDAGEGKCYEGNHNFMNWNIEGGRFHDGKKPNEMATIWGLLYNRTAIGAMQSARPDDRIFGLSRAATAGSQTKSLVWSGDHDCTWEELERELVSGLNMSMSGLPFWTFDIGGIHGMPSKELFVRWFQAGCFTPVMRTHGQFSREPWLFGKRVEAICRKYLEIRMQLISYLYSNAYLMHEKGLPLVKPLFWEDKEDAQALQVKDQWLLGDSFLVAPVYKAGQDHKEVYLPKGKWLDYWSNTVHAGNSYVTVDADLATIPLFIRLGSIVPYDVPGEYVDQYEKQDMAFTVYPGESKYDFTYYEDQGSNRQHEAGEYNVFEITCIEEGNSIEIIVEPKHLGYSNGVTEFTFNVHNHPTATITVPAAEGRYQLELVGRES